MTFDPGEAVKIIKPLIVAIVLVLFGAPGVKELLCVDLPGLISSEAVIAQIVLHLDPFSIFCGPALLVAIFAGPFSISPARWHLLL